MKPESPSYATYTKRKSISTAPQLTLEFFSTVVFCAYQKGYKIIWLRISTSSLNVCSWQGPV